MNDTNQFHAGDYVVFTRDLFGRVHKIKRVCKNGRVQIGRHYYDQAALRLLTDEELEHVEMMERSCKVTKYLWDNWDYLSEEEIQQLENIKKEMDDRLLKAIKERDKEK